MRNFAALLLSCSLLLGCGGGASVSSAAESAPTPSISPAPIVPVRITGVNGRLVRSPEGELSVVDGAPPSGFTVLAGATVNLVGADLGTTADPTGYFELKDAPPGLVRLHILPEDRFLTVPSFSAEAGTPIHLAIFPPRLALVGSETLALRAVGVDARGRYAPLQDTDLTWQLNLVQANEPIPNTSDFSESVKPRAIPDNVIGGQPVGRYEVVASALGVEGRSEFIQGDAGATGAVKGRVLEQGVPVPGATVVVGGTTFSTGTDSQGRFEIVGLPPAASQPFFVYVGGELVATALIPITVRRLREQDIPTLNGTFSEARRTSLNGAAGLFTVEGSKFKGVLVADQKQIEEYDLDLNPTGSVQEKFENVTTVTSSSSGIRFGGDISSDTVKVIEEKRTTELDVSSPGGLTTNAEETLFVTSQTNNIVHKFLQEKDGDYKSSQTFGEQYLKSPRGVAIAANGDVIVASPGNQHLEVFTKDGAHLSHLSLSDEPRQVAVDRAGNIYVLLATHITRFDSELVQLDQFGTFQDARGLAVDKEGAVFVSDQGELIKLVPSAAPTLPQPALPAPTGTSLLVGDPAFQALETAIQDQMQLGEIPGGSLSITVGGRLVAHRGYGWNTQSFDQQIPVQPDDLFRQASCSKAFAAVTLLDQLEDQPTPFGLGDTVFNPGDKLGFVSATLFDPRMALVTVKQLLQMTAGMNVNDGLYAPAARTLGGANPPASALQVLANILSTTRLTFDPGQQFDYSDMGYLTLGRLVEAVEGTGETYAEVLRKRILGPIGLTRVRVESTRLDGQVAGEVSYYGYPGEAGGQSIFTYDPLIVPQEYGAMWNGPTHDSCGGLIASTGDMVRFVNAVAPNGPPGFVRPLDDATVDLMLAEPDVAHSDTSYWAMGWFVGLDNGARVSFFKDGGLAGTMTHMEYVEDHQVAWAVAFNSRPVSKAEISEIKLLVQSYIVNKNATNSWPAGDLFPVP